MLFFKVCTNNIAVFVCIINTIDIVYDEIQNI